MRKMKNKTYYNVLQLAKYIQQEKHYDREMAINLAIQCFDNAEAAGPCGHSAMWFVDLLVTKEEWENSRPRWEG